MANGTWKIARRGNTAQLPVLVLVVIAIVLVLWGRAQPSLFDSTRTRITDWMRPALVAVNGPVEAVSRWIGSIDEIFSVYSENLKLKEENARLRQWHSAALVLDERVRRYQLLLNAVPDPALSSTTAHVIGHSSKPFLETMILDAGKKQNVKPGQAVVDARGMIGRIFLAGDNTSWVIELTDLNSRIPVVLQPGNIQAIMAGDNSLAPGIETLALGANLKEGMQVLTSGDGGLIPPGLSIGSLFADGDQFRVALLADASTASDVQVVQFKREPEKLPAPSPNDLPAAAAGMKPEPEAPTLAPPLAPLLDPQTQNPQTQHTTAAPGQGATALSTPGGNALHGPAGIQAQQRASLHGNGVSAAPAQSGSPTAGAGRNGSQNGSPPGSPSPGGDDQDQ